MGNDVIIYFFNIHLMNYQEKISIVCILKNNVNDDKIFRIN